MTDKEGILLFPDAFRDLETLARTLGHERTHIMQHRIYGEPDTEMLGLWEKAAYGIDHIFWDFFNGRI